MKIKNLLSALIIAAVAPALAAQHYVGGDISLLPEYEKAGSQYKTHEGEPIADLIPWLRQQGMNAMRVRLFVNPAKYKQLHGNDANPDTKYDPNACQDLEYIKPLCKRIVDAGMDLMLDFHYSDTWADPAKQWTPVDWEGLSDEQLYKKIYDYTKDVLTQLKDYGVVPAFIQPGNEISYGMLWGPVGTSDPKKALMGDDANWERFGTLLKQAVKACNEICPDAKIILHTERVAQVGVLSNFYQKMAEMQVPYDIIGLSYYPYFHGNMNVLDRALQTLQTGFPSKNIMIVETGYSYKWEVPGTTHDNSATWPYSEEGQVKFVGDLVEELDKYKDVDGLFWWWLEYNAYNSDLSGWYNAPLFDSTTGKATAALKALCGFATSGIEDILPVFCGAKSHQWYNIHGLPVSDPRTPGLYIQNGHKVLVR